MIGINFFTDKTKSLPANDDLVSNLSLSADANEVLQSITKQHPGFDLCSYRPYIHYPISTRLSNERLILLEGYVHGLRTAEVLDALMDWLKENDVSPKSIQEKLRRWSGDFFIVIVSNEQCWFFNDYFGRLSLYWYYSDDFFFVGRSLQSFFSRHERKADKMGVAQAVWCGYPINSNTYYEGVKKMKGNAALAYDLQLHALEILQGEVINFDEQYATDSKQAATELADLYIEGCRKIARSVHPLPINVSLSGGQDSRMVAWGFAKTSDRVYASTFSNRDAIKDVAVAMQIAAMCDISLKVYELQLQQDAEEKLLQWKQGMNYVGMRFIINFYEQLQDAFPAGSLYVTGDAADVSLRYLGEPDKGLSLDELVERHVNRYMINPLASVETITGVKPAEIKQSIYEVLKSYPAQDPNNKSYHYYIFERFSQYYFEGEDRSKCFFWATNPFFDLEFFHKGRIVPQEYKKAYRFFRQFMHALHYPLSEIPDANGYSINSWQYRLRRWTQEQFRSRNPAIKNWLHKMYTGNMGKDRSAIDSWQEGLNTLLNEDRNLDWMNIDGVKKVLATADMKQTQFLRNILKALTLKP
jgi:asparagine synthase (glutamine-hydrolysing)